MVYLLAAALIIPIILTIASYDPLWELKQEAKEEGVEVGISEDNESPTIFFMFLVIWLLIIGRMLYLMKKRAYTLRTKF